VRNGDVIAGRYQLEEAIGAGGMGEVWRATDLELRRTVALKQATTGDSEQTRREARVGAGLHHPHIISVFDVVTDDDRRWLVMEYLPAHSLADLCRTDGPVAPDRAAHIGTQIAAALSAMHAKGMVHRDITPANILVTDDGTAKLADLGIAMWDLVTLTGSATSGGTPGYLAPEVVSGHRATPAADLYSLGVTLAGATEGHPDTDTRLTRVLSTLTDPDPTRRPTADKAAQLLAGHRPRQRRRTLVGAGLGLALALTATFVTLSGSDTAPSGTAEPDPPRDAALLYGMGDKLNSAMASELVRDTPIRMLTTHYHKPDDLTELAALRDTLVPDAYRDGYALHLVVSDWFVDDPEIPVETRYGLGCGRTHVLSPEFLHHMRTLANIFAGRADDPPLYVTVFQEVNKFACTDGAYADTPATTAYYKALMDRYVEVRDLFHAEAPNAQVGLGWQVWQASDDDPETGAGRAMFTHFADVLRTSDFQSVLAKQPHGNIDQVRRMVRVLGQYGPVMVAVYGNDAIPADVVDEDLRELLTDESIDDLTDLGLFAWNFNSEDVLVKAGQPTVDFVKDAIRRTAREPR
jgi:serine/threonine protein kinase